MNDFRFYDSKLSNEVHATDTRSGASFGPSGNQTTQTYRANDSLGHCYSRTLTAADKKLTSVIDGTGCKRSDDRDNGDH